MGTTNPNNGTVVFSISTGVDTTVLASQTGYQSTYVAPPAPPAPPAAAGNATGTGATNFGNVVGCAYAKTVSDATTSLTSDMCTASAGPTFTYLTGSSTTNTVSAARRTGSSVAVALKVYHSLLSQTAATAAVTQVGTTLTTINAAVAAINAAAGTNFSTAQLTASGMTVATWTHSSASVVVPSITAMFSALLLVLMQ